MRCEGEDIERLEAIARQYEESTPLDLVIEEHFAPLDVSGPRPGPAGEGSLPARVVAVSRWSLAARIKQGERISNLRSHFEALLEAEERLLNE